MLFRSVGINEIPEHKSYMNIYPNPTSAYSILHYVGDCKNATLSIVNNQAHLIYSLKINKPDERITINTAELTAGFYICNITSNSGTINRSSTEPHWWAALASGRAYRHRSRYIRGRPLALR